MSHEMDARIRALRNAGFTVGDRDPRINRAFVGAFMVAEAHDESELPTDDGSDGPWAIVGDNLEALIIQAYDNFVGDRFPEVP